MREVLHIILLILGFVAILFATYFVTRLLGSRMSYSNGARYLKIVDRVFVGNDKSICIIQVGKRSFVVGITNHHIEPISELTEADLIPLSVDRENSFNNLFDIYMSKFRDNKGNGQSVDRIQQIKDSLEKQKRKMRDM